MPNFKISDKVRSTAVGNKPAFDGIVSGFNPGNSPTDRYIVKDENGSEWIRSDKELTLIPGSERDCCECGGSGITSFGDCEDNYWEETCQECQGRGWIL